VDYLQAFRPFKSLIFKIKIISKYFDIIDLNMLDQRVTLLYCITIKKHIKCLSYGDHTKRQKKHIDKMTNQTSMSLKMISMSLKEKMVHSDENQTFEFFSK